MEEERKKRSKERKDRKMRKKEESEEELKKQNQSRTSETQLHPPRLLSLFAKGPLVCILTFPLHSESSRK